MIGSGLKKLAQENGMKVAHGVAYGSLQGYAATMSEGSGYKQILFSTAIKDPDRKKAFLEAVGGMDVQRRYRVQGLEFMTDGIQVIFLDNPGTMAKIGEFNAWFIPLLREYEATPMDICPECGCQITGGKWVLVNGVAHHLHDACAQKVVREVDADNTRQAQEKTGSYGMGLLGAALGATIGAILWAVVLMLGYVASLVGLVIGLLAEKGYTLFKGKQGRGKLVILIAAIIFGVLLGTFGAYGISLAVEISKGAFVDGITYGDIPGIILLMIQQDGEFRASALANVAMGLLFAALGVYALIRKTGKEVSGQKVIELE